MRQMHSGKYDNKKIPNKEPLAEPIIEAATFSKIMILLGTAGRRRDEEQSAGGWSSETKTRKVPTDEACQSYAEAVGLIKAAMKSGEPKLKIDIYRLLLEGDPMKDAGVMDCTELKDELGKMIADEYEDELQKNSKSKIGFGNF